MKPYYPSTYFDIARIESSFDLMCLAFKEPINTSEKKNMPEEESENEIDIEADDVVLFEDENLIDNALSGSETSEGFDEFEWRFNNSNHLYEPFSIRGTISNHQFVNNLVSKWLVTIGPIKTNKNDFEYLIDEYDFARSYEKVSKYIKSKALNGMKIQLLKPERL